MQNGVQFEHSHRLVATSVGLMTIALAVLLHRRRRVDPMGAWMGYLAVFLVCAQGTLGGITVLMKLPIVVTLSHLGTSMAFFCLMVLIALRAVGLEAKPAAAAPHAAPHDDALTALRPWQGVAVLATLFQIVLGGVVRHTASGLACFGIPLCNGEVWPEHNGAHIHMSHRFFAVVLGVFVVGLALAIRRRAPRTRVAKLAALAILLVLLQVGLGILSVLSLLALAPVTLHLGVAGLLLACNVALFYYLPARARQPSAEMGEAASRGMQAW